LEQVATEVRADQNGARPSAIERKDVGVLHRYHHRYENNFHRFARRRSIVNGAIYSVFDASKLDTG
jgi:hypothetical protein